MVMMLILLSFVILFPDAKGAESIQLKKLFPHTRRQKKKKKIFCLISDSFEQLLPTPDKSHAYSLFTS